MFGDNNSAKKFAGANNRNLYNIINGVSSPIMDKKFCYETIRKTLEIFKKYLMKIGKY